MTRRFSSEELNFLRNKVPIEQVVETLPGLSNKKSNGKISFTCPICGGFDTSINAAHNLARCFACRRNFNPIELVMHQLKIDFVDSVKWLKSRMSPAPAYQKTTTAKSDNTFPTAIGDILSDMMPSMTPPPESKNEVQSLESIVERISRLEQHLGHLYRLLKKLQSSINQ